MAKRIEVSLEEILQDLIKLNEVYPDFTRRDYDKYGTYSSSFISKKVGMEFNDIKRLAELPVKEYQISKEDLINDIMKIYKEQGFITQETYLQKGKYSRKPILRLFGSWNNMLLELNLPINCFINIEEEILINELIDLYKEYGYCSAKIITDCSKFSLEVYQRRFVSLNNALEKAGLPIRKVGESVIADSVIDKISDILEEKPDREKDFDWLINDKTGRKLYIDAFFPSHNLAVEYNGKQHYETCESWLGVDSKDNLEVRQYRDKRKAELLKEHNINLLIIKYDDSVARDNLIKKVAEYL